MQESLASWGVLLQDNGPIDPSHWQHWRETGQDFQSLDWVTGVPQPVNVPLCSFTLVQIAFNQATSGVNAITMLKLKTCNCLWLRSGEVVIRWMLVPLKLIPYRYNAREPKPVDFWCRKCLCTSEAEVFQVFGMLRAASWCSISVMANKSKSWRHLCYLFPASTTDEHFGSAVWYKVC